MAVEENVLPGNLDGLEDQQRVELIESARQRVADRGRAAREAGSAEVLEAGSAHSDDEADRLVRDLASPQFPMVGFVKARLAYAAALAPRATIPLSDSRRTCSSTSGSWYWGRRERSPFGRC